MKIRIEEATKTPLLKQQNVAAYARVSVDTDASEHSLSNQVEFYSSYIKKKPMWTFVGVYADEGFSGTKANRPGFQNLLRDCEKGKIDIILCKSISRFARNTIILLETTRHLKKLGINVWFEKENLWSISPEGEFLLTVLASFAQEESRSISENIRWRINANYKLGKCHSHVLLGYRWEGDDIHIVEEEAAIVRLIFSLYLAGHSPQQIEKILADRGIKSRNGYPIKYHHIWKTLRMEQYSGNCTLRKTYCVDFMKHKYVKNNGQADSFYVTESHPPIIDQETWKRTQTEISRREKLGVKARQNAQFSFFSGNVYCAECGSKYSRRSLKNYHVWKCRGKIEGRNCVSQNVPEDVLFALSADVLGRDEFDEKDFNEQVERVLVKKPLTLIFVMKDGRRIEKTWQCRTSNSKYWGYDNVKDHNDCRSDKEQVYVS